MKRLIPNIVFLAVLFVSIVSGTCFAQDQNGGIPGFSSIESHQYDSINLQNLSVVLNIPIRAKAGPIPFNVSASGTSYAYATWDIVGNTFAWNIGSTAIFGNLTALLSIKYSTSTGTCPNLTSTSIRSGWNAVGFGGTTHSFSGSWDSQHCLYPATFTAVATDGSGLTLSVNSSGVGAVTDKSGNVYGTGSITDTNGNSISVSSGTYSDSLSSNRLLKNHS
jgi:hypothetical protein